MTPKDLFETSLGVIDRVIAIVCRRAHLFGPDAEDFASEVKLALIEDDYAILRKYEGRSSLDTFLTVVIQRMLADARTRAKGRWHASTEAQRGGPTAVLLETLVRRDGRSLDEALPLVRAIDPRVTREALASMLEHLPARMGRPRTVAIEAIGDVIPGGEAADARVLARDTERTSNAAAATLRAFMSHLAAEDRVLIRLHYVSGMSVADVARITQLPQRPLYRRLESLLVQLRRALAEAGIDRRAAAELVGQSEVIEMDFGLTNGKSENDRQSIDLAAEHAREEP
ncbi:MAG: sigma-70 family RNA polymerase sigma factor [Thermoanaerobaculia bacterium]